jgi:hypothetical protein
MNAGILKAASVLIPLVKAFVIEAEATGASGADKKKAVEAAVEAVWESLQAQFPQLRPYSFDDYRPYLSIATDGIVTLFDNIFGKLWGVLEEFVVDPIEGFVGIDIDGDGDINGKPKSFNLKPVKD